MNSTVKRLAAAAAVLAVAGVVRMPAEQALTHELRDKGLLSEPLNLETRKKVGQGFWAVSLGGLRTLVATVLNLRGFSYFENRQWTQLADTYDTIVQLAPNTDYYWDTGSWHMAYNAAAHYLNTTDLPALRKQAEWRRWIEKGNAFLKEGTRQNPDSWYLWSRLGWHYSDPNKLVDYEIAADAYRRAVETGNALPHILNGEAFALARIPGREKEALDLVRERREQRRGRVPTMNALHFALEHRVGMSTPPEALALSIFGDKPRAYRELSGYYTDTRKNFPKDGVASYLKQLETDLMIPEADSVLVPR